MPRREIKSGTAYSLLAAPLLFFLFQIAGEPFKGNAEDAGEDGKLIVGHEAVAGLDAADGLLPRPTPQTCILAARASWERRWAVRA